MKKNRLVELLAPAGTYEAAIAAIQNGCDAFYFAAKHFGARAYAGNFDDEEIEKIVVLAHAYGVKAYAAINTLIHDAEIAECLKLIDFLYCVGIDALIMQDLGMICIVKKRYPDLPIHASTQMHIVNSKALCFLRDWGIQRAILARETTIEELRSYQDIAIEKEIFVHGALCVSYSGQCQMSESIGGRSANRGACAQPCRLPYRLIGYDHNHDYGEGYLLSLKDLNTLNHLDEILDAGVSSLKIEGRMKKSEYVAFTTKLYYKGIHHEPITKEELQAQKTLFHRGYSEGHLYHKQGSELANFYRPNHMGVPLGEVEQCAHGRCTIKLSDDLHQFDGIRILMDDKDEGGIVNKLYVHGKLENSAAKGEIVEIEVKASVPKGSKVVKTSDAHLEKKIRTSYENHRKVPVRMRFIADQKGADLIVRDGTYYALARYEKPLEKAKTHPMSDAEITQRLSKTGDTIFKVVQVNVRMDPKLFIPVKVINQLRRDALVELYRIRAMQCVRKTFVSSLRTKDVAWELGLRLIAKVKNEPQLLACVDSVDAVFVEDRTLYATYRNHPKVHLSSVLVEKNDYEQVAMVEDLGGVYAASAFIAGQGLNAYNAQTVRFLHEQGATMVCLSNELNQDDIRSLIQCYESSYDEKPSLMMLAYGRRRLMTMEHCPINALLLDNDKHCDLCRHQTYALQSPAKQAYPLYGDKDHRIHVYDAKITNRIHEMDSLKTMGITHFLFDFTFEDAETIQTIFSKIENFH